MELLFILIVWLFLCGVAGAIANKKGRSVAGFFFLSLFLSPLVGVIAALIAKPNSARVEGLRVATGQERKCPFCAEIIKAEAKVCRFCGRDLSTQEAVQIQEEKARVEAQQKAAIQRARQERYDRDSKRFKIAGIVVGSFFALLVVLAIVSPKRPQPSSSSSSAPEPAATEPPFLAPGQDARVVGNEGDTAIIVAPTKDALEKAEESARKRDVFGVTEGGAFIVNGGTHVLILEESGDFYRVRVLGGTMPGSAGWVRKDKIGRF